MSARTCLMEEYACQGIESVTQHTAVVKLAALDRPAGTGQGGRHDVVHLAHLDRLRQRLRALRVVEGRAGVRRQAGRPQRARPRGVLDRATGRRPSAAVHRGARGEDRRRTGSTSTCGPAPAPATRRSAAAARSGRHPGATTCATTTAPAGSCSPTPRATSSASCAAWTRSSRHRSSPPAPDNVIRTGRPGQPLRMTFRRDVIRTGRRSSHFV